MFISILWLILFFWVGLLVTGFTLLSILICIFFAIPSTVKLKKAGFLIERAPIIRNYWITVFILLIVFSGVTLSIFSFTSALSIKGYMLGLIFVFVFGLRKVGTNPDNVSDYISTQLSYLKKPVEEVAAFLLKNK